MMHFMPVLSLQNISCAVRPAAPHGRPRQLRPWLTSAMQGTDRREAMCEQLPQLLRAKHQVESVLSPCNCFTAKF